MYLKKIIIILIITTTTTTVATHSSLFQFLFNQAVFRATVDVLGIVKHETLLLLLYFYFYSLSSIDPKS